MTWVKPCYLCCFNLRCVVSVPCVSYVRFGWFPARNEHKKGLRIMLPCSAPNRSDSNPDGFYVDLSILGYVWISCGKSPVKSKRQVIEPNGPSIPQQAGTNYQRVSSLVGDINISRHSRPIHIPHNIMHLGRSVRYLHTTNYISIISKIYFIASTFPPYPLDSTYFPNMSQTFPLDPGYQMLRMKLEGSLLYSGLENPRDFWHWIKMHMKMTGKPHVV